MAVANRTRLPGGTPPAEGMAWVPRATFRMGSSDFYPEERPVHRVTVDGFWMDEHPVTAAEFRRFVRATGYVTLAERPLDPDALSRRRPRAARARLAGLPQRRPARSTSTTTATGGRTCPGAYWRHPEGPGSTSTAATAPGRPRRVRGRGGVRRLGGQGAADRGRVGVRRARRPRGRGVRVGRRALPRRQADGEHVAGRVPLAEPQARRLRGHVAGRELPAERLRPRTT